MSASRSPLSSPRRLAQAKDAAELVDIDYESLPSVTDTAEAAEGQDRGVARLPGQHLEPVRGRQPGGDRGRLRQGRAHRQAALRDQPGLRPFHGAARRDRRLGPGRGPLHALCRRAVPAPRAPGARDPHLQDPGKPASGSSPAMSAAGSAPRAGNIPSTGWCCWRRRSCAGRSNGPASAARRSRPTSMPATMSATPSWRSTATANSSACGSRPWPMSAPTSRPSATCSRPSAMSAR